MAADITFEIEPTMVVITPNYLATMSNQMHLAGKGVKIESALPFVKYYLFCVSIELSCKSAILALDCTHAKKRFLQDKIGHDLRKAIKHLTIDYEINFLNEEDTGTIEKINPFFKNKGLEYLAPDMMHSMLCGFKQLPDISVLESLSAKFQKFLEENQNFRDGKTSEKAKGGVLVFI